MENRKWYTVQWRLFLPIFYICLEVPFIRIQTCLMHNDSCKLERQYVALQVRIFKWRFELELYDTERRVVMRRQSKEKKYDMMHAGVRKRK